MAGDDADAQSALPAREGRRDSGRATIYDIARLAGVNPSTVSRALSKPGRISAKTEERINAAAKQLDYRLNPTARALPTGRTNMLGLLIADITNPMFFDVVRGAERAAAERGFMLIFAESQDSGEREAAAAERLLPSVDALILLTTRLADDVITKFAAYKPLMVVNRSVDGVPSLIPDVRQGIAQALAHLAELGHSSVAYLPGPDASWMSGARWEHLLGESAGLGIRMVQIRSGAPTLLSGAAALSRVLEAGVTAVVTYNDLMAIGLLRAARAAGIEVPGEFSIVGFDDIFGSDFTSPPLTTIRTPLDIEGEQAVNGALELIESAQAGEPGSWRQGFTIGTELVVRESTGPAPR